MDNNLINIFGSNQIEGEGIAATINELKDSQLTNLIIEAQPYHTPEGAQKIYDPYCDMLDDIKTISEEIKMLIMESNENQGEILQVMLEGLHILKEKDKEKAKSKYRKFMDKVITLEKDFDAGGKLITYGNLIYTLLNTMNII